MASLTTSPRDRRAAGTASRPACSPDARCGARACRPLHPAALGDRRASPPSSMSPHRRSSQGCAGPRGRPRCRAATIASSTSSISNISPVYGQSLSIARCIRRWLSVGAVAEPDHPVAAALEVVGDLLDRLRGDLGDARVGRALQLPQQQIVPGVEQELPRHVTAEVAVRLLDQQQVAEFAGVAQDRRACPRRAPRPRPRRRGRARAAPGRSGRAPRSRARCPPPAPARGRTTRRAVAEDQAVVADRQELERVRPASGAGRTDRCAAAAASSTTSACHVGSDGITCAPASSGIS